jgi:hypothetical protein
MTAGYMTPLAETEGQWGTPPTRTSAQPPPMYALIILVIEYVSVCVCVCVRVFVQQKKGKFTGKRAKNHIGVI